MDERLVGIRGAIDVAADSPDEIRAAVARLVREIESRNGIGPVDIVSAWFTVTADLKSSFPAQSARAAGWSGVPMLCASSIPVPGSLPRCVRVLVHAYRGGQTAVEHVYLGNAVTLRPDLRGGRPEGE